MGRMENADMDETSHTPTGPSWRKLILLGLLALALIAAASAYGGYQSGINLRIDAESAQKVQALQQQFALAELDLAEKNLDRARQRLEYVIRLDPAYPGAAQRLAEVLLQMNSTATPTVAPTPTVTPTPDTRNINELFSQSQQYLANKDWTNTIETLLSLRKADPNFRAVDIDGMLFLAFRNRGKEKIARAELEEGIYDLTLAERFGPLDSEAQGFLTWTRLYITGASFWEINWEQVVYYFSQVAPAYPSLMDGSGLTAKERYRLGLIGYGYELGKRDQWCEAVTQFQLSLELGYDQKAEEGFQEASKNCAGLSDEQESDEEEEQNPLPVEATPTFEETPPPTPEATPAPPEEATPVPTENP